MERQASTESQKKASRFARCERDRYQENVQARKKRQETGTPRKSVDIYGIENQTDTVSKENDDDEFGRHSGNRKLMGVALEFAPSIVRQRIGDPNN